MLLNIERLNLFCFSWVFRHFPKGFNKRLCRFQFEMFWSTFLMTLISQSEESFPSAVYVQKLNRGLLKIAATKMESIWIYQLVKFSWSYEVKKCPGDVRKLNFLLMTRTRKSMFWFWHSDFRIFIWLSEEKWKILKQDIFHEELDCIEELQYWWWSIRLRKRINI